MADLVQLSNTGIISDITEEGIEFDNSKRPDKGLHLSNDNRSGNTDGELILDAARRISGDVARFK